MEKTEHQHSQQPAGASDHDASVQPRFWDSLKNRMHAQPPETVSQTSAEEGLEATHGSTYHPAFWGAYKGHVRGLLRGLLLGALAGAIVGGGLALLAGPLGLVSAFGLGASLTTAMAGGLIATMTGVGAIIGCELMGKIGNTAGNTASYFAQKEIRARYPSLPEVAPGSPAPGIGHHFEVPPDKDLKKVFNWRVALPGIFVGLGIGSLLAFGIGGGGAELLSQLGLGIFTNPATGVVAHGFSASAAAATVGAGGLMGASFGINRGLFRSLFNYTDSAYDEGRLTGPSQEQITRDQARYKTQDPNNPYPITGAQMYEEYQRLLNGYYKKSFTASWSGDRRGLLGGALAGSLSGLAAAGFAVGIGTLAVGTATLSPFILPIVMFCTALGARQGMHIFSDAGRESAAVSVAHELHAERIKALHHGHDISFDEAERRASERMIRHPDLNPPGTENKTWFNWKIGLIGLGVGALVGVGMAPLAAPFIGHITGAHVALNMAGILHALPLTTATFSLIGGTMAMGDKLMEKMYKVADKIFMGTFFPGHHAEDHISHDYPALGPDSRLLHHGKGKEKHHEHAAPATSEQAAQIKHEIHQERHDHTYHASPSRHVQKILEAGSQNVQQVTKPVVKASSFAARREQERQEPAPDIALVRP